MNKYYPVKMELSVSDRDKVLEILREKHDHIGEYYYLYNDTKKDDEFFRGVLFNLESVVQSLSNGQEDESGKVHITLSPDAWKQLIAELHIVYSCNNSALVNWYEPLSDEERNEIKCERDWAYRLITGTIEYHFDDLG